MLALRMMAAFVFGLFLGFPLVLLFYYIWSEWLGGIDRDGGVSMAATFYFAPLAGLLMGLALAAYVWRSRHRH